MKINIKIKPFRIGRQNFKQKRKREGEVIVSRKQKNLIPLKNINKSNPFLQRWTKFFVSLGVSLKVSMLIVILIQQVGHPMIFKYTNNILYQGALVGVTLFRNIQTINTHTKWGL